MPARVHRFLPTLVALACVATACGSDAVSDADAVTGTGAESASVTTSATADDTPSTTAEASTTTSTTLAPTTTPAPTTTTNPFPPVPRVLLIGDSTLLAVEAYHVLDVLRGMDPVYEAKSCRLLAIPSCGKNPAPNSVETIDAAEGLFDIVVIMAGYDEWFETFASSFDQVVASARAKGAKKTVWLSYPEGVDYLLPDGTPGNDSLVNINQIMRDKLATGAFPDVVIADWYHYSSLAEGWFAGDDIHLSPTGAHGVADYISRKVAFIASQPCPMPRDVGGAVEVPCPDPDISGPVADVVTLYDE